MQSVHMTLTFLDAASRHAESPDTFEVPSPTRIASVLPGDFLKIGLVNDSPLPGRPGAERFWVEVTDVQATEDGPRFTGRVSNRLMLFPAVAYGDLLTVSPRHVLDVMTGARQ